MAQYLSISRKEMMVEDLLACRELSACNLKHMMRMSVE